MKPDDSHGVGADLPLGAEGQRPDGHGLHRHPAPHPPDVQHQEFHPGRRPDEEHLAAPLPGVEQDPVARQQGEGVTTTAANVHFFWVFFRRSVDSQLLFLTSPQDAKPLEVYSIEFMVDNNQLGFLGKLCGVLRTPFGII